MKKRNVSMIFLFIFIAAVFLAPLASQRPDGLERIAKDAGFADQEKKTAFRSPFAEYRFPGVENEFLSTAMTAILAGGALFFIVGGIAAVLRKSGKAGGE